jgi:UDP-glucuronate 4-epimerase
VARYLVTGCAGFIGSHLVEALLERGDEVVGVDTFTDYYARATKEANLAQLAAAPGFRMIEADVAEIALEPLLAEVDAVFHLAAQPGVRGSWGRTFSVYSHDNIVATQRVFETAAAAEKRVVWASSSSVYGNAEEYPTREDVRPRPISPYGVTKLCCEQLAGAFAECFGLDSVALRYFTVYGPRQRPDMAFSKIVAALAGDSEFVVYGTGGQTRDVTYVGDAVAATIAAMDRAPAGAVYNVGGGSEISLQAVIDLAEQMSGRRLRLRRVESAAGDVRRTAADTSRAREELGWSPRTPTEQGLRAHLAWGGALEEAA